MNNFKIGDIVRFDHRAKISPDLKNATIVLENKYGFQYPVTSIGYSTLSFSKVPLSAEGTFLNREVADHWHFSYFKKIESPYHLMNDSKFLGRDYKSHLLFDTQTQSLKRVAYYAKHSYLNSYVTLESALAILNNGDSVVPWVSQGLRIMAMMGLLSELHAKKALNHDITKY